MLASGPAATAIDYPGPQPGPAHAAVSAGLLTVSNRVIAASWTVSNRGLRPGQFSDTQTGLRLALTGQVFQIVLADGTHYQASAMLPEPTPVVTDLAPQPGSARLADRVPGRTIQVPLRTPDDRLKVLWRAVLLDAANYVRQEIEVLPTQGEVTLREIIWVDQLLPGATNAGSVDGSVVVAGPFFLGCEDPMALNQVAPATNASVICRLTRPGPLQPGQPFTASFVVGVAPAGQVRRAFLHYIERERAHPYRPFLHYNCWYDIAWAPFALNETNCLEAIRLLGERFIRAHGVVMDALVFDDGWDDPRTLWQTHAGFPRGFTPLADLARQYQTRLGVWLSPFGGYGQPRKQRIEAGVAQGFETNASGFSLAGPKYYAAFKRACLEMIRRYGVNHFKFDGIAAGTYANGAAHYRLDTEAMRRLMLELRAEAPDLYINFTTGSWPSPFWLRYADSIWRQGGDMGLAGKGPKQQQWITYRDQEVHRNIVRKAPLFPLNALMTQGVAYSRHGPAGEPTFNSAGFKDDVRAFFASGTSLQELYIQPGKLTPTDWAVLAEAAKWARTNANVLVDTHWVGGDPDKLEPYGYASWTPRKGILMLRNPDDQPHEFILDLARAFELPHGAPTNYLLRSPWAEYASKPPLKAQAGQPLRLTLQPFQVLVLEAVPPQP